MGLKPQSAKKPNKGMGDQSRTRCKLCPYLVFHWQDHLWLTKPVGFSHTYCADKAGLIPTATP